MWSKVKGFILDATGFAQIPLILIAYGVGRIELPKSFESFDVILIIALLVIGGLLAGAQRMNFNKERQKTTQLADQIGETKSAVESLTARLKETEAKMPEELMPYGDWLNRETDLIARQTLRGRIPLDGKSYAGCTFIDPVFTYHAHGSCGEIHDDCEFQGEPPKLEYGFEDLRSTLGYLKAVAFVRRDARLKI